MFAIPERRRGCWSNGGFVFVRNMIALLGAKNTRDFLGYHRITASSSFDDAIDGLRLMRGLREYVIIPGHSFYGKRCEIRISSIVAFARRRMMVRPSFEDALCARVLISDSNIVEFGFYFGGVYILHKPVGGNISLMKYDGHYPTLEAVRVSVNTKLPLSKHWGYLFKCPASGS